MWLLTIAVVGFGTDISAESSSTESIEDGVTVSYCHSNESESHSASSEDKDNIVQCMSAYIARQSGNITVRGKHLLE